LVAQEGKVVHIHLAQLQLLEALMEEAAAGDKLVDIIMQLEMQQQANLEDRE
jgi:hypothetical protein